MHDPVFRTRQKSETWIKFTMKISYQRITIAAFSIALLSASMAVRAELKDEQTDRHLVVAQKVKLRHILYVVPQDESGVDQIEKAEAGRARLDNGEDFAIVATEESEDPASKVRGGDLGTIAQGDLVPEFERAAFTAPIGKVIGPIRSRLGWHLFKVQERFIPDAPDTPKQRGTLTEAWHAGLTTYFGCLSACKTNECDSKCGEDFPLAPMMQQQRDISYSIKLSMINISACARTASKAKNCRKNCPTPNLVAPTIFKGEDLKLVSKVGPTGAWETDSDVFDSWIKLTQLFSELGFKSAKVCRDYIEKKTSIPGQIWNKSKRELEESLRARQEWDREIECRDRCSRVKKMQDICESTCIGGGR
jgi:hypothetical protein